MGTITMASKRQKEKANSASAKIAKANDLNVYQYLYTLLLYMPGCLKSGSEGYNTLCYSSLTFYPSFNLIIRVYRIYKDLSQEVS